MCEGRGLSLPSSEAITSTPGWYLLRSRLNFCIAHQTTCSSMRSGGNPTRSGRGPVIVER